MKHIKHAFSYGVYFDDFLDRDGRDWEKEVELYNMFLGEKTNFSFLICGYLEQIIPKIILPICFVFLNLK